MIDKPEEVIPHAAFYKEFDRTGKIYYGIGVVFLLAAFVYWAVQMFLFFSEFHTKGLLDLLLAPVLEFVINPLLWISIVFFKISQRHRLPQADGNTNPNNSGQG